MSRIAINPAELAPPRGFTHGFLCTGGATLFLAGQDASDSDGNIVAGDIVAQYEQILRNIRSVVEAAGGTLQNVVKLNIYVRDRDAYVARLRQLGNVHRRYFGAYYPALALFEVSGFFQTEALIEIEGFAYLEQ